MPPAPSRSLAFLASPALACAVALAALAADPPARPEDVRRRKGEVQVVERTPATAPEDGLRLTSELARAGSDLYATLFARGWSTGAGVRAATREGAERTARAIAGRLVLRGEGLPVAASRYIELEHARAKQAGERVPGSARDFFDARLNLFARAAGLKTPPREVRPVCVEAGPGGRVRADAIGFGLLAEVRLAASLAGPRRQEGGTSYIGATPEAGFEGLVLLSSAGATLQALKSHFAWDGKAFVEAALIDYDPFASPRWFPHEARIATGADAVLGPIAADPALARSRLLDQAAILLGACELARLKDAPPEGGPLFGPLRNAGDVKEDLFPAALAGAAKELARFVFRNLAAIHFDPTQGRFTFVSEAVPGEKGSRVDVADAALAVLALEGVIEAFPEDAKLRAEAKKLLQSQAAFLAARQLPDGSVPAWVELARSAEAAPAAGLAAEGLAIQAFLAAARATGEERFAEAALKLARSVEARRFDPWAALYLGPDPAAEATIAPADAAHLLGALRELGLGARAPEAIDRFRDVYGALERAGAFTPAGEVATLRVKVIRP